MPASDVVPSAAMSSGRIMWGCLNVPEAIEVIFNALEMSIRIVCQFGVTVWELMFLRYVINLVILLLFVHLLALLIITLKET